MSDPEVGMSPRDWADVARVFRAGIDHMRAYDAADAHYDMIRWTLEVMADKAEEIAVARTRELGAQ